MESSIQAVVITASGLICFIGVIATVISLFSIREILYTRKLLRELAAKYPS